MGIMATPGFPLIWQTPTPATAGFAPDAADRLDGAVSRGDFSGLHAVLVLRNNRPALERYYRARDEVWGQDLGIVQHGPDRLHDLRSISKSVVGLLYGIALAEDMVPPVTARLMDHYPAYCDLADDARKRRITIAHVLSMRMGLDWQEDTAYDNPANSDNGMEAAPDRYRYILCRPMAGTPGRRWLYCGGATALLADLIERGTGRSLADFARERLFDPMGIACFDWVKGKDNRAIASSGLRLLPRDIARLGQMVLDRGTWAGRRLVPAAWLTASFKPRTHADSGLHYGYQWWIGSLLSNGKPWHAGFGNGGQRLIIIPSLGMVVVILAGNYNAADQWKMPVQLMSRIVMPSVTDP